jgi:preprotein translocase subunit SecG
MQTLMLGAFLHNVLAVAFVLVSLLLIGVVLLQKNRGGGLSGAFGGVGSHSAFGTKTGDFLTWVTVGMVTTFLLLGIANNYAFQPPPSADIMGGAAPPPPVFPMAPVESGERPPAVILDRPPVEPISMPTEPPPGLESETETSDQPRSRDDSHSQSDSDEAETP